jgi:hypothetical protein
MVLTRILQGSFSFRSAVSQCD